MSLQNNHCISQCLPNSYEYIRQLESIIKTSCKEVCLDEFKSYIKSAPDSYTTDEYNRRAVISSQVLEKIADEDFKKAATEALYYLLFDNFHEDLKDGEWHLDNRIHIANRLFQNNQKNIKDIGAKAYLEYSKDSTLSYYYHNKFMSELLMHKDYKHMGIEALKAIIENMEPFSSNQITYMHSYPNPRNTENVIFWSDILSEIASNTTVRCEGRELALHGLVFYKEYIGGKEDLYDQCRKNKVCVKEIKTSLEHVSHLIDNLNNLADYPFACPNTEL